MDFGACVCVCLVPMSMSFCLCVALRGNGFPATRRKNLTQICEQILESQVPKTENTDAQNLGLDAEQVALDSYDNPTLLYHINLFWGA